MRKASKAPISVVLETMLYSIATIPSYLRVAKNGPGYSLLRGNEKCCVLLHEYHISQLFLFQFLCTTYFSNREHFLKRERGILTTKTGLILCILPQMHSSVQIIIHILIKTNS